MDASLGRSLMDPITKDSDVSSATVASQVSSTLPTLNNVNLTSGNDVVTPRCKSAEVINAALGGLLLLYQGLIKLMVVVRQIR